MYKKVQSCTKEYFKLLFESVLQVIFLDKKHLEAFEHFAAIIAN